MTDDSTKSGSEEEPLGMNPRPQGIEIKPYENSLLEFPAEFSLPEKYEDHIIPQRIVDKSPHELIPSEIKLNNQHPPKLDPPAVARIDDQFGLVAGLAARLADWDADVLRRLASLPEGMLQSVVQLALTIGGHNDDLQPDEEPRAPRGIDHFMPFAGRTGLNSYPEGHPIEYPVERRFISSNEKNRLIE